MNDVIPDSGDGPGETPIDPQVACDHVREAWLNLRIFDEVDAAASAGYAFDPSEYAPVAVEQDGEQALIFART